MIKKFISKGILGIPDMEVELEDEKIIIIKGPNGSGKSSLLKQITHPFSSHNKFNRLLKSGENEGHTIMYVRFRNNDYKIQHLYSRTKKSVSVLSYLSRYEDGKWIELVENGLPTTFKEVCKRELDYEGYMYDILNIGVENRGMIDFTNMDKIEYLKKILKMEILNELKKNVLENINSTNAQCKFLQGKLAEFLPVERMAEEIKSMKSRTLEITAEIEYKNTELAKININEDISTDLRYKESSLTNDKKDLENIQRILVDDLNYSYNDFMESLNNDLSKAQSSLIHIDKEMDKINEELLTIKDIDNSKLEKERNDLQERISHIDNKYEGKKFKDIPIRELEDLKYLLDALRRYIEDSYSSTEVLKALMRKFEDIEDYSTEFNKSISDIKSKIEENALKLQKIDISGTLTSMTVPEDCNIPSCALRIELNRQLENLDIYSILKTEEKRLQDDLLAKEEESSVVHDNVSIIRAIRRVWNEKDYKGLKLFFSDTFENLIDNTAIDLVYNDVIEHEFYYKDMKDKEQYINSLEKVNSLLEIENKGANEKKKYLLEDLERHTFSRKEEENNIINIKKKIQESTISINNHNNSYIAKNNIQKKIEDIFKELVDIKSKIKDIDNKEELLATINREKEELNMEMKRITDAYYEMKLALKESMKINEDFTKVSTDMEKLKVLKEVVSTRLPARTLEGYLHDIAHMVNTLLEEFMTIRFDVKEGIDILVNRDGIERHSGDLSQGEKSMLAMALLMAIKKNISWDIISLDEIDATLDETNKSKFIYLIRDYSEMIQNLSQIFIVTHTEFQDEGIDVKIINL